MPGTLLAGRYRIVALLGRGGMGEVYRADDLTLRQPVALKFLPPGLVADRDRLARFHDEVRLARQVSHPNVCRVHDIGESERGPFLSMEHIEGEDLASALRRVGRLTEEKALEVARQVAAGLAAAHAAGVVHRDLKPANVMLDAAGRAHITDFGLAVTHARLRGTGETAGTPAYMAPEQIAGEPPGPRADVWSFGVLLYEVLTGVRPYAADSLAGLARAQHEPLRPAGSRVAGIPAAVESLLARCLAVDPRQRPADGLEVLAALAGDRMRAAIEAGQTPSPEAVASAGIEGALRPAIAWACFAAAMLCLLSTLWLTSRVGVAAHSQLERSPDALTARVLDVAERLGFPTAGLTRTIGFTYDTGALMFLARHPRPPGQPSPILFWCRLGDRVPAGTAPLNALRPTTPPLAPGELLVVLDPAGRLVRLQSLPHPGQPAPAAVATENAWRSLLDLASADDASLTEVAPARVPPAYANARRAWKLRRGQDELRLEGALLDGRPVWFESSGPWHATAGSIAPVEPVSPMGAVQAAIDLLLLLALVLAWRNVRAGRGDTRGAFRLGLGLVVLGLVRWAGSARHVPELERELDMLDLAIGHALQLALSAAVLYLALEPHVRRRWPEALVSWSRLLAGRLRDPMIGRDTLVGLAAVWGAALVSAALIVTALPRGAVLPLERELMALLGLPQTLGSVAVAAQRAVHLGMVFLLLLLLSHSLGRRRAGPVAFGLAIVALISGFWTSVAPHTPVAGMAPVAVAAVLYLLLLTRLGLLSAIVALFVSLATTLALPDVLVATGWASHVTWTAVGLNALLATYGLVASVGRQPLLPWAALEKAS